MAAKNGNISTNLGDVDKPVWIDDGKTDVQSLFKNPYFVPTITTTSPPTDPTTVGQAWYTHMKVFNVFLFDTDTQANNVFTNGVNIYNHLLPPKGNMPYAVPGYSGKFPAEAVEKLRIWYNQGGRVKTTDPFPGPNAPANPIPAPTTPPAPARPFVVPANPVWDSAGAEDDIKQCFTNPCWIPNGSSVASGWAGAMKNFEYDATLAPGVPVDLQNYDHVKGWARNIYMHVASQAMPISAPYFSVEACEAVRLWYNQGCPQSLADVGKVPLPKDPIPPEPAAKPFLVRKDINTLTAEELTLYRMALLNLGAESLNSTWQVGGFLHANWCLHYMQASFPWHRAHLLWLETQIGMPIPYWNFYSSQAANPSSPDSGIPQAFLDETFIGTDGQTHPNPLRWALARNGISRGPVNAPTNTGPNSALAPPNGSIQRAQQLAQPSTPAQRDTYIQQYVPGYLSTIHDALQMTDLGGAQSEIPFTWSTSGDPFQLNDLSASNPAVFYSNVQTDFDGLLEQAHDNLHGWTGGDMANNSFAAFDPLFWSFHANFDRLFETWIRTNDQQVQWSSNYPLRPFTGRNGLIKVDEGDMFTYRYTTIGNMVVNTKALGYAYAPPGNPDYAPPTSSKHNLALAAKPMIMFPNIQCSDKTYYIHVALNPTTDGKPLVVGEPGYVGHITRLGMGPDNGNNRCIKGYVVRRLDASKAMKDLGAKVDPDKPIPLKMKVVEDHGGVTREVPESEYQNWKGFKPVFVWDKSGMGSTGQ